MIAVYLVLAALLLLLNALFVLAEFALVKLRPSRVEELRAKGVAAAGTVRHIQENLDEYLSVCQLGITFASIGLGFVGEAAFARLIEPLFAWAGGWKGAFAHGVAITAAYILVSFLHILFGELVPKGIAIRKPEPSALLVARILGFFRLVFYPGLLLLQRAQNLVLRVLGLPAQAREPVHSEHELREILEKSQSRGVMSFRRLLLLENVFDLGALRVKDAMRPREAVRVLRLEAPWRENLAVIRESRFSRYPVLEAGRDTPIGSLHVKDLVLQGGDPTDLRPLVRQLYLTREDTPLETALTELQRHRGMMALVVNARGRWTGILTFEDILEELVGAIEDEFEREPAFALADTLTEKRIVLDVEGASIEEAVRRVLERVPADELPAPRHRILREMLLREKARPTYLGRGVAVPHARLSNVTRPAIVLARSREGIPLDSTADRARLLILMMTPKEAPHIHARLLARLANLMDSEYVRERLTESGSPAEILEAIRAGDPVSVG